RAVAHRSQRRAASAAVRGPGRARVMLAAPAPSPAVTAGAAERRARRRNLFAGIAWTSPWLLGSALFVFAPMAMSLYYSFTDYPLPGPPLWCGTENYQRLAHDPIFWRVVNNTALYAACAIPLYTLVSLLLAAALAGRTRMTAFYRACIFIPTLVPL